MTGISIFLSRLSERINRLFMISAVLFLVLMLGAILIQVVARYLFDNPPNWTEEVARYAMVWIGLLGAAISFHASFDPALMDITKKFPPLIQKIGKLIRASTVLVFLLPIFWHSFFGMNMNFGRSFLVRHWHLSADTFDLSTFYIAIGVPIFILAILIHGLAKSLSSSIES